ncbi:hypothetical protein DTO166G4_8097 [Paecilomyces variotii]|uniref:Uncharacterized protein n=1 Tax=Byssochlamys spectabilis TaxID=264951 RepID=A0A443I1Y4_BYSSP|nr:hypothetical protein C8Q69DRAFT_158253 [Paecilomyces variotii]KAJ9198338.1 hypothetical protein DTO164E3_5171 [Paecilomyces variotii]KAJ9209128.1 hypothetical protein DTO032I3_345 [Paecilomyces variotii]KAJ9210322.1 hypothetical protein DTO166G4_8097 [Paecilomyces variotii]KAJ9224741.1 hypothetical protein DTO169C6_2992 [Paecilomyces variotii]KAJ9233065.1 hypothetical protein DTO166G5_5862 [Paecilomyces variotii]
MSDTEQEWKPKARPQSTMAQAFSLALDSAFSLDTDVDQLEISVDQKKQMVMIQNRELEALQARIREAEQRLKARQSRVLTQSDINKATGHSQRVEGEEKTHTSQSPLSSPISGPSDEGSTGSATSAATSHDMDDPGDADFAIDEDHKQKNKADAS